MKKSMIMVFLIVLMLSVTACQSQSSDDNTYDKYEDLIEAIEQGDAQLAQEELSKFFDEIVSQPENTQPETEEVIQDGQVNEEQTSAEIETEDPLVANMRAVAISEWIPSKYTECKELGTITINEDGSCMMGGETMQWEIVEAEENFGYVHVFLEQKPYYELYIYKEEEGCHCLWVYKYSEDGTKKENLGGNIYRVSDLEKTEITIDNWEEFFVYDTEIIISKNEFEEPDDVFINEYLKVNPDKISKVIEPLSKVAYEYKFLNGWAKVNFDVETQEYTAEFHEGAYDDTCMSEMQFFSSEEDEYYGGIIESCWITELPYNENAFWEEYKEMLRIQGVIYSVK